MEPTGPVCANFRNRIIKRLGESGKERLGLTKKQYTRWLEERLREAKTVEAALETAMKIIEAKSKRDLDSTAVPLPRRG